MEVIRNHAGKVEKQLSFIYLREGVDTVVGVISLVRSQVHVITVKNNSQYKVK